MLLISIQPFAFRKIFLLIAALLGLSSAACFGDSLFMSLHSVSSNHRTNRGSIASLATTSGGLHHLRRIAALELSSHHRFVIDPVREAELYGEISNPAGAPDATIDPVARGSETIEQSSSAALYTVR
jgi:hypothetical protein